MNFSWTDYLVDREQYSCLSESLKAPRKTREKCYLYTLTHYTSDWEMFENFGSLRVRYNFHMYFGVNLWEGKDKLI